MSNYDRGLQRTVPVGSADMAVDAGLRGFMLGVYNKVALGLLLSAGLAYLTASYPPVMNLLYRVTADGRLIGFTTLGTVIRFAPIALILVSMFAMRNPSPRRWSRRWPNRARRPSAGSDCAWRTSTPGSARWARSG